MMPSGSNTGSLQHLEDPTRSLVRLAAVVTAGSEDDIRRAMTEVATVVPHAWVEELLLQTYLFAGFPRALNATREWRRVVPAGAVDTDARTLEQWRADGERTCAAVYGAMYARLRENIRALHDRLDDWMVTEGYGKVLSRPALDLPRRELCIVAACAAAGQDRQLHSHLHGALNVGVAPAVVTAAIDAIADVVGTERARSVSLLWARVVGK
jgi:4-carboxymuconolactone decarboxylase